MKNTPSAICHADDINKYEQSWGTNYKSHPLIHQVSFVPVQWLLSITSRLNDVDSNDMYGNLLDGHKLNSNLISEGMSHPIIISINSVGTNRMVRLDCGQHRVRIAAWIQGMEWLPCFVEVTHGDTAFIRDNGPHEYILSPGALQREPDAHKHFMKPSDLFARYDIRDIQGAEEYLLENKAI